MIETLVLDWVDISSEIPKEHKEYFVKYEEEIEDGIYLTRISTAEFTGNQHDGLYFVGVNNQRMGFKGHNEQMRLQVIAYAEKPRTEVNKRS